MRTSNKILQSKIPCPAQPLSGAGTMALPFNGNPSCLTDFHKSYMLIQNLSLIVPVVAQGGQPNPLISLLPFILLFAGMYFLIIAPQRRKQKVHDQMVQNLQKGDKIVTNGGLYGEITALKQDRLVVKIAENTRIELNKNFVHSKLAE